MPMLTKTYERKNAGFTLVEMAIVLVITGMLFSGMLYAFKYFVESESEDRNIEAIERSQNAILWDMQRRDTPAYPCPADPTLGPGDNGYGRPACNSGNVIRLTGFHGGTVLKGAVPFKYFLDPNGDGDESDAIMEGYLGWHGFDRWGNKLTYAVTERLTDIDIDGVPGPDYTFDQNAGAIEIVDETANVNGLGGGVCDDDDDYSLLEKCGTAHFVIISHGKNGVGAFREDGTEGPNCSMGIYEESEDDEPADPGIFIPADETLNCRNQPNTDAVFLSGVYNEGKHSNDDMVRFVNYKRMNLWNYSGAISKKTSEDLNGDGLENDFYFIYQIHNTNPGNVGLGVENPSQKLEVDGDIQALAFHADSLCDSLGEDCMLPDAIGGELEDMKCPEGEVVYKIVKNTVKCRPPQLQIKDLSCPPGQYLYGISSTGPLCDDKVDGY